MARSDRNIFKFVCVDCHHEQLMHKAELSRRCKPRCLNCGSTFLEAKTALAKGRIADGNAASKGQRRYQ